MDTRTNEFVTQAREHLSALEQILLSLESPASPAESRDRIDGCLRLVHSLKGDAGFLGHTAIRTLANAMETVLEAVRDHTIADPPSAFGRLLAARDRLAALVDDLDASRDADLGEILGELEHVERSAARGEVSSWDIDLRQVDRQRSGRLAEFFAGFERLGQLSGQVVALESTDLSRAIPQGVVRFRVRLASARPEDEVRLSLGLPMPLPAGGLDPVVPLSIDLADWVQVSRRPLGALLARIEALGSVEQPTLEIGPGDLATGLPGGQVVLRGQLRPSIAVADVFRQLELPSTEALVLGPTASLKAVDPYAAPAAESHSPSAGAPSPAPRTIAHEHEKAASLRISVDLLDRLMTLIGELTLIRNQSVLAADRDDGPMRPIVQRLDGVTSALQETVLRTRMQPVGNLFGKFPRVVRDLGRQLGKQVEIHIVGREVELDKTILEQLSDPLTHLVRNSVDHGIEMPEVRVANGKPAAGQITLSAAHEDGQVRIEIRDDGRGIDPVAVRTKALAMRLKSEAELDRMTSRELISLILLPGFSTAREITEVSGRGVGMDVVKTNIELLEGSLAIDSVPGVGSSMILRLPLTLAIIPCLIVSVRQERFAIPQRELEEAVCLHPELSGRIEQVFDTEVYRLRDRLLPVVRFRDILDRPQPFTPATKAEILAAHATGAQEQKRVEYILVLRSAGRRFGLVVDDVRGTEEIVVKPLHPSIKRVGIFTGATIMGDGRVALIADVTGILDHARLSFDAPRELAAKVADARKPAHAHRVLLFEYGPHEQFGLPLLQIRRIEMVDRDSVERVGEHEYVTVDGVSMRIMRLDTVINVSAPDPDAAASTSRLSLIVPKFGHPPNTMAILVSRIVDTELLSVDLQEHGEHDQGILGSATVRGRLTLFLDIHRLTQRLFGIPSSPGAANLPRLATRRRRLFLVDDTPFFREVVKRYLEEQGHDVTTAVNGKDALDRLATTPAYDLIVSDIEMPVMDGWDFAREVRRRGITTPMLALTSLSGVPYEVKAKECGFDAYEQKLDHDRLVRKVGALLADQRFLN
jgi:two-component system chemotaxis sensor kinase CheA